MARIVVTGAGGFIGHALCKRLKAEGHWVRGVDIVHPAYEPSPADDFCVADLRHSNEARSVLYPWDGKGIDEIYHLAADMGGIGFISQNRACVVHNNALINLHMLEAARLRQVPRFLYSSSACVYQQDKQHTPDVTPLKEEDAWPADPEPGYGLEKLFAEKACEYYRQEHGLATTVVRFHNVYGPLGTYDGGREKAPAAVCRKVAKTPDNGEVEVWGDGLQTRTFMYIDDCVEGLIRLMANGYAEPLNLGRDELVTVDQLYQIVMEIAGKRLTLVHDLSKPQGVRGRNSDNSKLREVLGWEPSIDLFTGLRQTYPWIKQQLQPE